MTLVGPAAHEQAVRTLQASLRDAPPGRVRLAKRTSNLFRPRERANQGLDVSGLTGVIRIAVEPTKPFVALRHVRFADLDQLAAAVDKIAQDGAWDGEDVHFVDGVMFTPTESYLTLGTWAARGSPSDYTGQQIF